MSTKENPGRYDCYAKLAPDEPYFVLRGKDPDAPALIEEWAARREQRYGQYDKILEARECAIAMRRWQAEHPEARPSVPSTPLGPVHESAQPCGCDPGAKWVCEVHRAAQGKR